MHKELAKYLTRLRYKTSHHLGYPYNLAPSFKALYPFLEHSINNLGDPFVQSNYRISSRNYEKLTLDWFADLWKFERDKYWGYVTSCGTEGNLHSLYVARENLGKGAVLLASDQSHYSVFKAGRMFCLEQHKIETRASGEMNYLKLQDAMRNLRGRPMIINVNLGSTVRGAVDQVKYIHKIMVDLDLSRERVYIHGDAALFGMMLPFLEELSYGRTMDAVATSGHKFLGVPFPCGVLMMQKKWIGVLEHTVEYLNSTDTTMMGSRNGHAPLFMWHRIQEHGLEGFRADVLRCVENARLLCDLLRTSGVAAWRNEKSNIVYFTRPTDQALIYKWQLACEGDIAHVVVMPNVDMEKLGDFVKEMVGR
jgi:histidine decarboxylase